MDFMPFLVVPLWTSILHLDFVKGSFVVDVTQSSYQAEENHNITLEWTFTTKPDTPLSALKILCSLNNDLTLYYLRDGVEFSEVQDKKFSGRVQSDKDALREGRIRLQLSRLRTEDSGLYLCEVDTGYGRSYNSCRVTVSDANFTKSSTMKMPLLSRSLQTPDHQDTTPTNGRFRVAVVLIAFISAVAVAGLTVYFCCHHQHQIVCVFLLHKLSSTIHQKLVKGRNPQQCVAPVSHYADKFLFTDDLFNVRRQDHSVSSSSSSS